MTRNIRPAERGQELVEVAITFSVLFMIIMTVLDMGRATYYLSALQSSARVGARYGIINPSDTAGIQNAVINTAFGMGVATADITVELLDLRTDAPGNDTIRVTVTHDFSPATPLVRGIMGGSTIPLTSRTTMRLER